MNDLDARVARLTPEQRMRLAERLREGRGRAAGGLGPRPPGAEPRLSFGQERLWRLGRLRGDSAAYNMHGAYRLRGSLDVEALRAALEAVVWRHASLRTTFARGDGRPATSPPTRFELELADLTTDVAPLERIARWAERPLDTAGGPLWAARLWRLGPDHHVLSLLAHHLVCDGWSLSILERHLSHAYRGEAEPGPSLPLEYADFVAWERSRESSLRADLDFWRGALDGVTPVRLPTAGGTESGEVSFELTGEVSAAIDATARRARATPFVVLLALFAATIHRHAAQEELVVCTPVAGRPDPALEHLVGYFNDLVPIRAALSHDPDLSTLIARLRHAVLAAAEHTVPFQWIAGLPETRTTPLTRALFALNNVPPNGLDLPGISAERLAVPAATSDFELGWYMRSDVGRYRATVRYRDGAGDAVAALVADYAAFAALMTARPATLLSELPDRSRLRHGAGPARPLAGRPATPLESRLGQIWEHVFARPVRVDDDFFELGGHSLLAAELIAAIETELAGEPIPLASLFAAPTVARMARVLEHGDWDAAWASLVPIKPSGDRPPLFFVHAHGGNVIGYADLGRALSPEQPLYGLQAPGMDGPQERRRIEDMARTYVEEIRTVQATGPYVVGGWCLGGDVAFEMAQQLREAGSHVALVVMVDNPRPEYVAMSPSSGLRHLALRAGTRLAMERSNLDEVSREKRPRYVVERADAIARRLVARAERRVTGARGRLPLGMRHSQAYREERLAAAHQKAYETYRPRPYSGRVAIFRAERQPLGRKPDPSLGWAPLVKGPLILHELPGHRIGLLSEPRVGRSAPIIERAIRAALGQSADATA